MPANEIQFPAKAQFLFRPKRTKGIKGGRGSSKSWTVARALIVKAVSSKLRILCGREIQNSIRESVHRLLSDQIEHLELGAHFKIQENEITAINGSEFIFAGLRSNPHKIKSLEAVDIAWVEEAEKLSKRSLELLIPTIRKPGSELWFTFNPDEESDPVYQYLVINTPPDAEVVTMNWQDNPWFPEELRKEKDYLYRVDPEAAVHVWGGECRKTSNANVLRGKYVVEAFEPSRDLVNGWAGPYFGADWGFAEDPTILVKCWIHERVLYIEREAYGIAVENDDIAELFRSVEGADKHTIRADNARPETISHVRNKGRLNVIAAEKWPGSVEDGIQYLRSFERIVIHPDCRHAAEEARLWRYKTDKLTGDVLPELIDKHNHIWDGVRYALQPIIKRSGTAKEIPLTVIPEEKLPKEWQEAAARAEK